MKIGKLATPKFVNAGLEWGRKQLPTIMSVGAVVGLGATVYLALKAKPKADEILEEAKEKIDDIREYGVDPEAENVGDSAEERLKNVKKEVRNVKINCALDMAKVVWRPIVVGGVTIGLILGANRISMRRLASLGAAYEVATGDLKKYKEKTKEILGEKKESEIREAVAKEKITEAVVDPETGELKNFDIIETGKGSMLYFDAWSGRFFRSSATAIKMAVNEVNRLVLANDFATLDDFYYELGLPQAKFAEEYGFHAMNNNLMEVPTFTFTVAPNGEHAIEMNYDIYPRHKYDDECFR